MTNKEMMLAALKDSGHFIDRENNVVYVSPKFNHEAEKFDTDECKTLDAVMKRFPKMTIRESQAQSPTDLSSHGSVHLPDAQRRKEL